MEPDSWLKREAFPIVCLFRRRLSLLLSLLLRKSLPKDELPANPGGCRNREKA